MGCFVKEFKDNDGNRELFYKDSLTGGYHYLGQFRFVMSRAFPYGCKECGRIPEIVSCALQYLVVGVYSRLFLGEGSRATHRWSEPC